MRGVTEQECMLASDLLSFQLTRLMRGVTRRKANAADSDKISTHTPHARRDRNSRRIVRYILGFQLTRLMRGVTSAYASQSRERKFQLTRLMRGVTEQDSYFESVNRISTHTPHARRDMGI